MTEPLHAGLIGFPIAHSLSPDLHHGFMAEAGISGQYRLFERENLTKRDWEELVSDERLVGLNVTIPLKRTVMGFLDEMDESAREVGAVNTVVRRNGAWVGYNTDVYGVEVSLHVLSGRFDRINPAYTPFLTSIPRWECRDFPERALILGTGGAAQAVKYVLRQWGVEAVSVGRNAGDYTFENLPVTAAQACKWWINCTPVGSAPSPNEHLPLPFEVLSSEFGIFDLIYTPNQTEFMKRAKARGARTLGGLLMLKTQAKRSWSLFREAYYQLK